MVRSVRGVSALLVLAVSLVLASPGASPLASPGVGPGAAAGTGSISGTVTVPAGVDVSRVQINLWSPRVEDRQYTNPDPSGSYRFENLAAASYNVEYIGWTEGLIHRTWGEGVWPLALGTGQAITGIDVTLVMGATLSGTIRTNGNFDLSRVDVQIFGIPGTYHDVVVQPDGRWALRGVPTGGYVLRVDGRAAQLPLLFLPADGTYRYVTAGQTVTGIDVTLIGAVGDISGRITVPGGDASEVVVRAAGGPNWDVRAQVAPDGSFVVEDLPIGQYVLMFLVAGSSPDQVIEYWPDATTYEGATQVTVRPGEVTRIADAHVAAPTTVTLTSSKPVAHVGDPLRLTALVTSPLALMGGQVEFRDGDDVLGTVPAGGAFADLDLEDLPVGRHTITARFLGSGVHDASSSAPLTQWVSVPTTPVVTAVDLPTGGRLGWSRVSVRGTGLTDATAVTFGGVAGYDVEVVSPMEVRVSSPPGDGTVPVAVTTSTGTSPPADGAHFTYVDLATQVPSRIATSTVTAGSVTCQRVAGEGTVLAAATGVILNVTTVRPSGPGYVVLYPDTAGTGSTPAPAGSTVNFEPGADVANSALVAVAHNGRICWSTRGAPTAQLLLDVVGYTLDGSGIVTQASQRLLDTRAATHVGDVTGPVAPRRLYTVDVAGQAGVPDDAAAVLLNVTVAGVSSTGNLRVFPGREDVPGTSVLNYAPGRDKANAAIVPLGDDGTVSFWSDTAAGAQVILDVVGYVTGDAAYAGVSPTRIVDTRESSRMGPIAGPLAARQVYSLPVAGLAPVPDDAVAVVLNVTAIGATGVGNMRVYPDTDGTGVTAPPNASSINYVPGRDVPNQVVVALPTNGRVDFYSDMQGAGTVHLAVDVVGYVTAGDV